MFKALHLLLSGLLFYVAWLQLNDPDPVFWVSLYVLAAVVPLLSVISLSRPLHGVIIGISCGYCLAGLALTLPGIMEYVQFHLGAESLVQDMSPEKPYIEEGREFIGTVFAQVVVVLYWILGRRY